MIREVTNPRALGTIIGILASTALAFDVASPGSAAAEIVTGANYLSTDRDITDHADAANSGSLAVRCIVPRLRSTLISIRGASIDGMISRIRS